MADIREPLINEATFVAIIEDVASGLAVREAIKKHGSNNRAFYLDVAFIDARQEQYARAKEVAHHVMADEIIAIADQCRMGVKTTTKADGTTETVDGDMVERSRLAIDARKWTLARLLPRKYGDKLDIALSGGVKVVAINESDADLL